MFTIRTEIVIEGKTLNLFDIRTIYYYETVKKIEVEMFDGTEYVFEYKNVDDLNNTYNNLQDMRRVCLDKVQTLFRRLRPKEEECEGTELCYGGKVLNFDL